MDDVQKAALASVFRTLLAVAGGAIVKHGWANADQWTEISGAIVILIPVAWGVIQKYVADRNAQVRAAAAYQAGATATLPTAKSTTPPSPFITGAKP